MKKIKTYKGLKKGDVLYYVGDYEGKEEEGYSIVDIIVTENEKQYLYETHVHYVKNFYSMDGTHRHDENNLLCFDFFKLDEKEIEDLKLKITVANL